MLAALNYDPTPEKLSRKVHIGKKVAKLRLVWKNPKLSGGKHKGKSKVKADASYGRVLYNWNRYYDPQTDRYITSDPIGIAGGLNTYVYALGNPLIYYDEDGLKANATGFLCKIFDTCDDPKDSIKRKKVCPDVDVNSCCACCAVRSPAEFIAEPGSICCEKCARKYDISGIGRNTSVCSLD